MILHAALPELDTLDADALRAIILRQHEQLLSRDHELEHLKLLIAKLQRMQFGRRSEKIACQIEQLELKLEELQSERAADDEQQAEESATPTPDETAAPAKPTRTRRTLPDHLPRETRMHTPAEPCCPACGGTLAKLGEDVSEVLEYIPASFRVIRHVRPKLSCTACDVIVQAPAPSRPIERSIAGPGLLAHIMTSKFADHLPLNRQSEIYAREVVDLDRSTLAKWVGQTSRLLDPLLEALRRYVFSASKLHGDDTPVPVLAPGNGKTKTGRLWTYVRDDRPAGDSAAPAVWFAYSPDRKGEHPQQHLRDFRGIFQADAYAGYSKLYEDGAIQQAPCLAHYLDMRIIQSSPRWFLRAVPLRQSRRSRTPDNSRQSVSRKARILGDGRQRRPDSFFRPARFQKASSTSRFILRLAVMYLLVVAIDACPK